MMGGMPTKNIWKYGFISALLGGGLGILVDLVFHLNLPDGVIEGIGAGVGAGIGVGIGQWKDLKQKSQDDVNRPNSN